MTQHTDEKMTITRLLMGPVIARAIHVAADLGIADKLMDGEKDIDALSNELNVDRNSLYRLMRMLTGHGLFDQNNERFSLTALGECLASGGTRSLRDFILKEDEARWRSIGRLKDAVVNGTPSFEQIYGKSYFEFLASDPKMNFRFEAGMSNLTAEEDDLIAEVLEIGDAGTVVDIGGGRGGFISKILRKHPNVKGVLFELPHVVFPSNELLLNGFTDRCDVVSGSFFESVPKGGDIYTLKRVLHDWDDHSSREILKNCRKSLGNDGRLMVVEAIVPEEKGSHFIKDVDVYMMALFSGRERTENEFKELFQSAGLKIDRISKTGSMLSIIEAVVE